MWKGTNTPSVDSSSSTGQGGCVLLSPEITPHASLCKVVNIDPAVEQKICNM